MVMTYINKDHNQFTYTEIWLFCNHLISVLPFWAAAVFGDQKTDWELKPAGNGITDLYGLGIDFKKIAIRLLAVYCGFRDICPCIKQGHSFYP